MRILQRRYAVLAALCAGFMLGLTAPGWAGFSEGVAAYQRGDYATAFREFRPLAELGNAKAQNNLGFMYYNGQGVTQDYVQAHMWFNLAASSFPPGKDRDTAVKYRDSVAKRMTRAQISKAQKLARDWKAKKYETTATLDDGITVKLAAQ